MIWCSGVLATLRCLHYMQGFNELRFAPPLHIIPHLVGSVPPHRFTHGHYVPLRSTPCPCTPPINACHWCRLIPNLFSAASASLLPIFKGFPFHFRGLVTPLRSAHAPTGIRHARYSASPPPLLPLLVAPQIGTHIATTKPIATPYQPLCISVPLRSTQMQPPHPKK